MRRIFVAAIALLLLLASPAHAWERMRYEDEQLVTRSELIVVARLKVDSIQRIDRVGRSGRFWEYHATLLIDEILKGDLPAKELPIIIHYGLAPVERDGAFKLRDTSLSAFMMEPPVRDLSANNIWLLRRIKDRFGGGDGQTYGIEDPEDLQPLELKDYLLCYLAPDPEPAMRAHLQKQPLVSARATRYLGHREIERIRKLPDPAQRVERLLPYWLARHHGGPGDEVGRGMMEAGAVAGPYLEAVFDAHEHRRDDVIRMWGAVRYRAAVPRLIALLDEHDRFWSAQKLQKGWWNSDVDSALTSRRRSVYSEIYAAVNALADLGDASARDTIERTRARWAASDFDNPQIVEACDAALRKLPQR